MSKKEIPNYIRIISIHMGCTIRLERLRRKLSQYQLGLKSGTDSMSVGRIERAEVSTAWYKIVMICEFLNLEYNSLFVRKSKEELLTLVNDCYFLDTKLTEEKKQYYVNLKNEIEELF